MESEDFKALRFLNVLGGLYAIAFIGNLRFPDLCIVVGRRASEQPATRPRLRGCQEGLILNKVKPIYPPLARQARIQGTVILKVVINKSGDVENVQLFSGHPLLAQAALDAVKQWKYKPYLLNGEPVEVETRLMVNFSLADKPAAEGVVSDMPGGFAPGGESGLISGAPVEAVRPGVVRVSEGVMAGLVLISAT